MKNKNKNKNKDEGCEEKGFYEFSYPSFLKMDNEVLLYISKKEYDNSYTKLHALANELKEKLISNVKNVSGVNESAYKNVLRNKIKLIYKTIHSIYKTDVITTDNDYYNAILTNELTHDAGPPIPVNTKKITSENELKIKLTQQILNFRSN